MKIPYFKRDNHDPVLFKQNMTDEEAVAWFQSTSLVDYLHVRDYKLDGFNMGSSGNLHMIVLAVEGTLNNLLSALASSSEIQTTILSANLFRLAYGEGVGSVKDQFLSDEPVQGIPVLYALVKVAPSTTYTPKVRQAVCFLLGNILRKAQLRAISEVVSRPLDTIRVKADTRSRVEYFDALAWENEISDGFPVLVGLLGNVDEANRRLEPLELVTTNTILKALYTRPPASTTEVPRSGGEHLTPFQIFRRTSAGAGNWPSNGWVAVGHPYSTLKAAQARVRTLEQEHWLRNLTILDTHSNVRYTHQDSGVWRKEFLPNQ